MRPPAAKLLPWTGVLQHQQWQAGAHYTGALPLPPSCMPQTAAAFTQSNTPILPSHTPIHCGKVATAHGRALRDPMLSCLVFALLPQEPRKVGKRRDIECVAPWHPAHEHRHAARHHVSCWVVPLQWTVVCMC